MLVYKKLGSAEWRKLLKVIPAHETFSRRLFLRASKRKV